MNPHEAGDGESSTTMPEISIEVVEGLTDRATVAPTTRDDTQLAQAPERPTTPATEIVHPISVLGLDPDALPDFPRTRSTSETSYNPEIRRRRRALYIAVTAALSLIIVTSVYQMQDLGGSEASEQRRPVLTPPNKVPPASPPPAVPSVVAPPPSLEEPDRGEPPRGLLTLDVEEIFADGRKRLVRIGEDPIAANGVTIVNLWATWCKPCKEELPGFSSLFETNDWAADVRFTPILIDAKDAVWARIKFIELMPKRSRFFVDPLQGAVLEALRAPKLLAKDSGLPVTLVFDCRRRVRVVYTQGFDAAGFARLEEIVQTLRGELKEPYCKVRPRKPASTPALLTTPLPRKPSPSRCGNHICDLGETEETCCDCRVCADNRRCENPDGSPICVDSVSELKD